MTTIQYERAKELYKQGKSLRQIGDLLGISRKGLSKKLKEDGIIIRDPNKNSVQNGKAKRFKEVDESIFEIIDTEEKAYWLGFLYADGYVNDKQVELALKAEDIEHIKKFKAFMKSEHKISYKSSTDSYRITICSSKIASDLSRLGCIQAKSLVLTFPNKEQVPEHLIHHFMRGYFDGDGCIAYGQGQYRLSILGTDKFLDKYEDYILSILDRTNRNKRKLNGQASSIQYAGTKQVNKIYNFLYKDATIYLERKYNKFLKNAVLGQIRGKNKKS